MADYFAITGVPLASALHGADGSYSVRRLSDRERLSIEDYFFRRNLKLSVPSGSTAITVPDVDAAGASLEDFSVLVEFALGVLSVSGFQPVTLAAKLNAFNCTDAVRRSYHETTDLPKFPKKLTKAAASTWVKYFFSARRNAKDRLHIVGDRFVRYLRMSDSRDGLVDLCIALESLIESQSEISFRFSICLAKVAAHKDQQATSDLLSDLYDLRSKVVHGADSSKQHRKLQPGGLSLRLAARTVLTAYILYLAEHTSDEWRQLLRSCLFK